MTAKNQDDPRSRLMARFSNRFKQPDWALWKTVSNAPVWKIVALSLDIDPYDLLGWDDTRPARIPPADFHNRLEQIISALATNGGPLISRQHGSAPSAYRLELGDFRAWAIDVGMKLPEKFPIVAVCNPPYETREARVVRLTKEIAYEKSIGTHNPMAAVASRVFNNKIGRLGISTSRLSALVGSVAEQAERLQRERNKA